MLQVLKVNRVLLVLALPALQAKRGALALREPQELLAVLVLLAPLALQD